MLSVITCIALSVVILLNTASTNDQILQLKKQSICNEQFLWKERLNSNNNSSAPGYVIINSNEMMNGIINSDDINNIKSYWNQLAADPVYNFRKTRYSRIEINSFYSEMNLLPMKIFSIPNGQNAKLGTKPRRFAPNLDSFIGLKSTNNNNSFLVKLIWRIYDSLPLSEKHKNEAYHVGVHPFRIIIDNNKNVDGGLPTPEGIHRDGSQFVSITLINRDNVLNGTAKSGIYNLNAIKGGMDEMRLEDKIWNKQQQLVSYELHKEFETILLNDEMVQHDATDIKPYNKTKSAKRDVLVLTWMTKKQDDDTPHSQNKY